MKRLGKSLPKPTVPFLTAMTIASNIQIQAAQLSEADDILTLWRDANATVSPTDTVEDIQRAIAFRGPPGAIAAEPLHFLVARHRGQIVGSVIGAFDGWRGNIYRLVVHPDYRRCGVATALVGQVEARFRAQGVKRISALVEKEHAYAVAFWEAVHYQRDARIARYIHNLP